MWRTHCGQQREDAREAKRVELCGLKVPALKGLCDEHKLSKAGVKADLVSRLCDALAPVATAKRTGEEAHWRGSA